jgi:serine/threonine protein kinase
MERPSDLSELVLRWQELRGRGRNVTAEELCAGRPELLDDLRSHLAALAEMEKFLGSEVGHPSPPDPLATAAAAPPDSAPTSGEEACADTAAPLAGAPCGAGPVDDLSFLAPPLGPGEIGRLGPYGVRDVLGRGGMGLVLRAEDPQLARQVALKVMLPSLASSESSRKRFLREARAAAALEHDHVVAIYHVGEERGVPFLAMPLLKGETLADRLRREKRLPLAELLRIGDETARGLAAAHARGLVHRDIKPANLWLESLPGEPGASAPGGRVKILDFGLARGIAAEAGEPLTNPGSVVGTLAYMAPEQARGATVDGRGDLFSLGCVLYEMATGERPFRGSDPVALLQALALEQPRPPRALNSHLPQGLEALILRLLAKRPEDRPASAEEVSRSLRALAGGAELPSQLSRRLPQVAWVAAAVAVLLLVTAGGYLLWQGRERDRPPSTADVADLSSRPTTPDDKSTPRAVVVPRGLPALKGSLDVLVARGPVGNQQYYQLSDPDVLPLRAGEDYVRITAKLNRPAYLYLVWVNTEGKADLIHPWDDKANRRPADEQPLQELSLPSAESAAKLGRCLPGTESLLLLARDTKLPANEDLEKLFAGLPAQTSQHRREAAWFENGRPVQGEEGHAAINFGDRAKPLFNKEHVRIEDPVIRVQALLQTPRLRELFPYSRGVCFSNRGDR